jgi:hypothetical protein
MDPTGRGEIAIRGRRNQLVLVLFEPIHLELEPLVGPYKVLGRVSICWNKPGFVIRPVRSFVKCGTEKFGWGGLEPRITERRLAFHLHIREIRRVEEGRMSELGQIGEGRAPKVGPIEKSHTREEGPVGEGRKVALSKPALSEKVALIKLPHSKILALWNSARLKKVATSKWASPELDFADFMPRSKARR